MRELSVTNFSATASRAGFIVFGALFSPIILLYLYGLIIGRLRGQEFAGILPLMLLFSTCLWLLGFKIIISANAIKYRNGLWRWRSCLRDEVSECEMRWIEYRYFGRVLKIHRLVIYRGNCPSESIVINPKPFSRETILRVKEILNGRS